MTRLLVLSGLVVLACGCDAKTPATSPPGHTEQPTTATEEAPTPPVRDLTATATARMLRNFQAGIDLHTAKAEEREDNWLSLNLLAKTYLARTKLT